jgi:hypothetical protein
VLRRQEAHEYCKSEQMEQQEKTNETVLFLSYVRGEKWAMYDSLIANGK